jgi:hypothetical protein
MSNYKPLNPSDIDETLVKFLEFGGKRYVVLPFVDATGSTPEYRSVGHLTPHPSLKVEDLQRLSTAMASRAQGGAAWFILFNTPWLVSAADSETTRKPTEARQ